MADTKKVEEVKQMVYPYDGTCACCGSYACENNKTPYRRIKIGAYNNPLCDKCFRQLYTEMGKALQDAVELNDTVWELTLCDDNQWRIFPMIVKNVCPHGSIRQVKGKETDIWNIYAENPERYTYMYKNFYELGKSWFLTEEEAKAALEQKLSETE